MRFSKKNFLILILSFNFIVGQLLGQQDYTLLLNVKKIVPTRNVETFNGGKVAWQTHEYGGKLYAILQFEAIPTSEIHAKLKALQIELLDYLPNKAYNVRLPKTLPPQALQALGVRAILPMQAAWKLSEHLRTTNFREDDDIELMLMLHPNLSRTAIEKELSAYGTIMEARHHIQTPQIVYLKTTAKRTELLRIAELPYIKYLQLKPNDPKPLTRDASIVQRANVLRNSSVGAMNLSGAGVVVGVGDAGTINEHIDLDNRLLNANNVDENGHGTKVTGIIAGEGLLSPNMQGLAPGSEIVADIFSSIVNNTGTYYSSMGMVLTNNSYGTRLMPFCSNAAIYDPSSNAIDQFANNYPNVLHCFAAGNDGEMSCSPYPAGFSTVFQGLQSAKNAITVGSIDAYNNIADDSSRGPTRDGRIKPELVGVGVDIDSPGLNNSYTTDSGTSFATPSVTGTLALLWEHYRNENGGANPSAALMKAIACTTADDLGNAGPDFTYGFGRINALRAANVITNQAYLEDNVWNNTTNTHTITVPANTAEVRVLLYWADEAAAPNSNPALVNNLDLRVEAPSTMVYLPWTLDGTPANVQNPAVRAVDNKNNIELVTIDAPTAGTYTIEVEGTSIALPNIENYQLVYEIIPEHVQITHPTGGETFNPSETILITWNAAGDNTQTFTLEYSLNNGASWIPISNSVAGDERQYEFILPNTTATNGLARIRRNGTSFSSGSNAVFSILATPSNFSVSPSCDGTINLSWEAVTGVPNYNVLEYQAGNWIPVGNTANTSFSLSGKTAGQLYCYTLRANYGGGIFGRTAAGECVVAYDTAISDFPYLEDFEGGDGNWFARGKNNDWAWGTPSDAIINSAASGTKAWATNLNNNYYNSSEAYLYSPCFDLSSLTNPELSFSFIYKIEDNATDPNTPYDIAWMEYSLDGKVWTRLGWNGMGINWYSNAGGLDHWDGENTVWHTARCPIPSTSSRVQFRLLMDADQYSSEEGMGIDDICISESGASCIVPKLQLKVMLNGNHDTGTGLMKDDLRQNNYIPLTEPYTSLGYTHVMGGGESTTNDVLSTTGNDAIIDWVVIEVRDATTPTSVVATRAALLQADGDVVDVDGVSPVAFPAITTGNYHVAVRHRNHLGAMTAMPVSIGN